jgi:hypothetical protein
LVASAELPLVQSIESNAYWIYSRATSDHVRTEALKIRDAISDRSEYRIYRTLIGFEGVFGDWSDQEAIERRRFDDDARKATATELALTVSDTNFEEWRQRILSYAQIESNDLATFPVFVHFLTELARAQPRLALDILRSDSDPLDRFIAPVLRITLANECRSSTVELIDSWIGSGKHLYQVMRALEDGRAENIEIAVRVLSRSAELGDMWGVAAAASLAVASYENYPESLKILFLPALRTMAAARSAIWVIDLWYRRETKFLLSQLDGESVGLVLESLKDIDSISYQAEEILFIVASSHPTLVLGYLFDRLESRNKDRFDFTAIPHRFDKLQAPLSKVPHEVVRAARQAYESDPNLFQYRGASIIRAIFPEFSEDLERSLINHVRSGREDEVEFVIDILRAYEGEEFTHEIAQEIVLALPFESNLLGSLEIALQSTGVVMGEFGFVEAYRQKIDSIRTWPIDSSEKIAAFVARYIGDLESRIVREQKRAEEGIALRKHEFGDPKASDDPV